MYYWTFAFSIKSNKSFLESFGTLRTSNSERQGHEVFRVATSSLSIDSTLLTIVYLSSEP